MGLTINKNIGETSLIAIEGRLDTTTAPELEAVLNEVLPVAKALTFDLEKLEYISSAGLRLILKAQKAMNQQGSMKIIHVPAAVMEVFDITGFADFLTIEG